MQERLLRTYCNNHHYNIIGEEQPYKDYDVRKPKLKQIYDYCRMHRHEVDKVLFLRWDRLSRNFGSFFSYKRKFYDELGIEINAIESPINYNGTEWSLLFGLFCGFTQIESENFSHRIKEGIHSALLKGRYTNKAPRGYINRRNHKGESNVEIDETQARIIRQAFQEVAKGVEAPNNIRRRLCPNIQKNTFYRMLRNIFYIGLIRVPAYNEEPELIVKGLHQPIIDANTFDKVQVILNNKTERDK